jgi:probable F420-dependent oxidoreductase
MYYDVLDPFVALSAAAAVTAKIKLATGICLVVQRDPIQTAKQVASLDLISQGRFLFGVGAGWNEEEMNNHGTAFETRFALMRERIEAMIAIWTHKEAAYHGKYVDFDPIFMWPKPVQKPHPPIHVGGAFPGGARRAVRYGNGWIPIAGRGGDITAHVRAFRKLAAEAGRDPASLEVSAFGVAGEEEEVKRYREAGFDRAVFGLPPAARDVLLPVLDRCAKWIS